jgi:hypothetical protein
VQAILRNQLALTREQVEAYQHSSDEQDATLAWQAKAIAELQEENQRLAQSTSAPFRVSDDFEFVVTHVFYYVANRFLYM